MFEEPSCVLYEFCILEYAKSNIVEAYIMCCYILYVISMFFLQKNKNVC
jgi:hypothetical protein